MRVLVCGGRDYTNKEKVYTTLYSICDEFAVVHWTGLDVYPADWERYGLSAGYRRNRQMLEEGKPDLVVAFPGGKGTNMMVDIARKAGVPVRIIDDTTGEET